MGALRWISVLGLGVGLTLTGVRRRRRQPRCRQRPAATSRRVTVKSSDALKFEPDHLDRNRRA